MDVPKRHWSAEEIADEVVKRTIVPRISERTINRLLADMDLKPHRSRYWQGLSARMSTDISGRSDAEQVSSMSKPRACWFKGSMLSAWMKKRGFKLRSESTRHNWLHQVASNVERREYDRHGTCCLIASLEVALGQVIAPTIGATRTEKDFAQHIEAVIATDPQAGWCFIVDQLNTHKSETLVRLVSRHCNLTLELGEKGQSGILASMESRAAFLTEESHRIRFVYTPKHSSWRWSN